ncbi:MAG: poly-beta-1,6-N-acetyl-D-glucosamine biosynthesis protein PgaD [Proteobacteria bacterium]|nr:poly-beta-1,6-N-acetyl-D-glucosamine biosynthesis protein PgaD [Pseudomonadota bacterium]
MKPDAYIVSIKPKDRRNRARDTFLTLLMWGVYIYLWIPLITLGAWLAGFDRFYEVMINYGGFDVVMGLLDWYALMIITIAGCIVSWSGINYRRFHGKERRYSAPGTEARKISEFFGVPETEIDRIQSSRRLLIDLDDLGCISNITHGGYNEAEEQGDP